MTTFSPCVVGCFPFPFRKISTIETSVLVMNCPLAKERDLLKFPSAPEFNGPVDTFHVTEMQFMATVSNGSKWPTQKHALALRLDYCAKDTARSHPSSVYKLQSSVK